MRCGGHRPDSICERKGRDWCIPLDQSPFGGEWNSRTKADNFCEWPSQQAFNRGYVQGLEQILLFDQHKLPYERVVAKNAAESL